jgi:hypothetical protein
MLVVSRRGVVWVSIGRAKVMEKKDKKIQSGYKSNGSTMEHTVDTVLPADEQGQEQDPFSQSISMGENDDDDDDNEDAGELTVDWEDVMTDAFATGGSVVTVEPSLSGRPPNSLYLSCDPDHLSPYQVAVRRSIEIFEAQEIDVESGAQGRNRPVVLGQLGIRCRFCSQVPPKERTRGAMYYPSKLLGVYQAGQNLATTHLCETCTRVPSEFRAELCRLRDQKTGSTGGKGGKVHWAKTMEALSVHEDEHGLRYGHFSGIYCPGM